LSAHWEVQSLADWERAGREGMLSVVIPAHNEAGHIEGTLRSLTETLQAESIEHEILVVNDNSGDDTEAILARLSEELPAVRYVNNEPPNGFGFAVRLGLAEFRGDAVATYMADNSDDPADLVRFYRKLEEGYDCVFGSRFDTGGELIDYPLPKMMLNRLGNWFIQALFVTRYNDVTNAFKLYRRSVIAGIQPLMAHHFNLTVELPLKAMARGYSYAIVPNRWTNRSTGESKFHIREMGSRYFFIILYAYLEKTLTRQDYSKRTDLWRSQLQVWRK